MYIKILDKIACERKIYIYYFKYYVFIHINKCIYVYFVYFIHN